MPLQAFRDFGLDGWTMRHAFFADMGGIRIRTFDNMTTSPVTAEQLLHLVQQGHVEYPVCDKSFIDDKNKRDGLSR